MKLITADQRKRLLANHEANLEGEGGIDHKPVVKIFTAGAGATWLLTEMDEDGIFFGLCDLGLGFPELGYVSQSEFDSLPANMFLERDAWFTATKTLSEYASEARGLRRIAA
tara:strand:- start:5646 stop:5981 length:336 start_codon:yes stop_codon:yes gene_type:complete